MGAAAAGFFRFWYDFIVGDDWTVAAGVIAALAATYMLAHRAVQAWWIMPLAVGALLLSSLRRAAGAEVRGPRSRAC
jgi:uncharacterized membrane protein HdeD (DUF308 family)